MKYRSKKRIFYLSIITAVYLLVTAVFLYSIWPQFPARHALANTETIPFQQPIISYKSIQPTTEEAQPLLEENQLPPIQHHTEPIVQTENTPPTTENVGVEPIQERAFELLEEEETRPLLPTQSPYEPVSLNASATAAQFGQLIIPSIGVMHQVTAVPVVNGSWDISQLDAQVGHLQTTGEQPGDNIAMTFIGHVTVPWPGTGPFADLILLKHGEEIIYRWNGYDYIYEVSRIFRVEPNAVEMLYHDDPNAIQIATCSGWNLLSREYGERLITRATLVRVVPANYK